MPTVKTLSARHPSYDRERLERWEALYEGGACWRNHVAYWIPQNPQEPDELWHARKNRAAYANDAAPVVDLIAAWCFSSPPDVDGLPEQGHGAGWDTNVDGQGTSLTSFMRAMLTTALTCRTAWTWCNLPARPDGAALVTRADEEAAGVLAAYLVDLEPEHVINWGEDAAGGLQWVVIADKITRQAGPLDPAATVYRWTVIDATTIRRWEWTATEGRPSPQEQDEPVEVPPLVHGWTVDGRPAIPVVRLRLPHGLHVLGKIEDVVVDLTRADNDLGWALHRGAHEMMVLQLANPSMGPTLGAGYYMQIGQDDKVSYASPSGTVYDALTQRITDRREQVYRAVQQMAQSVSGESTPARASGASKALDWQALSIMLDAYAELVKVALRRILALVVRPLTGRTDGLTVEGLDGWSQDDLTEILTNAAMSTPMVPSPTFRRETAKRIARLALTDLDAETEAKIDAELDAETFEEPGLYAPPPPTDDPLDDELDELAKPPAARESPKPRAPRRKAAA